jgi:hypothetical protein
MASPYFIGAGLPTNATNWSTGSVVTGSNADTGTIDARMASGGMTGANQLTVTLSRLDIYAQQNNIGSAAVPWQIGAGTVRINLPPADGSSNSGPAMIALDTGTNLSTGTVYGSRSSGTSSLEPVQLQMNNANNVWSIVGGVVGFAKMTPASTSTAGTFLVTGSARLNVGSGGTLTTLETNGQAAALVRGTVTNINARGGKVDLDSTTAPTLITLDGGTVKLRGRISGNEVTTITVNNSGTIELDPDVQAVQVGTINVNGNLTVRYATAPSQLTVTTWAFSSTVPSSVSFVKAT